MLLEGFSDDGCAGVSHIRRVRRTRDRRREVRTAVYLLVVLTAGVYLPSPLHPDYQHAFGFSDLTMTLIYAMFALVSAPALVLFGPASDAVGPRAVLRTSLVVAALASGCFALAHGPGWLLAGRAAQGLALGAATGAATALITDHAPGGDRLRASVLASVAFVAGTAAGPIAAGTLAQYAPAPRVLPYLVHLVLLAIGWWRVSALTTPVSRSRRWRPTRPRIPRGMRLVFGTAAATGFLAWTVAGLFLAVVPTVLSRGARISDLAIIGGIVGAVLACSAPAQLVVARCGAHRAQLAGLIALLACFGALALTGGSSVAVTVCAAVAAGIGHGLAYGGAAAAVGALAPDSKRGEISSALYIAFYCGAGGPAVAVGLLTLWYPLHTAVSWLSAAAAVLVPFVGVAVVVANRAPGRRLAWSGSVRNRRVRGPLNRRETGWPRVYVRSPGRASALSGQCGQYAAEQVLGDGLLVETGLHREPVGKGEHDDGCLFPVER
ncbi:Predicted arabinose efflux permease, MFS family [Haloechinothrix alba]|uniref:Predicted arabinose efflux permease, MFS family n=1 Tax=Haloechinothrix alba TaxID=664784 RepID=A0A238Y3N0_9PSEU|nr:MFS transporter [Haloechinothrix alba]SNR65164.1 Predicted arabinose efflux permease, MFS family [Haloechinothrix alba]